MNKWLIRLVGSLMLILTIRLFVWVIVNLNREALWLAVPFAAANFALVITAFLVLVNNWSQKKPPKRMIKEGQEPWVAIVIPTWNEPPAMVFSTVESVILQQYPKSRMIVIVSDDGHSMKIRKAVSDLLIKYPEMINQIFYFEPPKKDSKDRRGESKSGNLNAVLQLLEIACDIKYIETRDADDLVGDPTFLRQCVGQLAENPDLAFVQTIKKSQVAPGDPFNNNEPIFYQSIMLGRYSANAVFPCGSGLVWRKEALESIGGFPTWNLVEDLQAGIEVLSKGWKSMYLPIVGTVGQVAPEDIPCVFKQRGTWALDTMRLFFWRNFLLTKGLTVRQKLAFLELGIFYLLSFVTMTFVAVPVISLTLGVYPLITTQLEYAMNFWPQAVAIELYLVLLGRGMSFEQLWRSRQMWIGLAPVYVKACIQALLNGPSKKPIYKVTRKEREISWYWKETLPQTMLIVVLAASIVFHLSRNSFQSLLLTADLGSVYWAGFFIVSLSAIVRKSWFGCDWKVNVSLELLTKTLFRPRYALATMVIVILLIVGGAYVLADKMPVQAAQPVKVVAKAEAEVAVSLPSPLPTVENFPRPIMRVIEPNPSPTAEAFVLPTLTAATQTPEKRPVMSTPTVRPLSLNAAGKVGLGIYSDLPDTDFRTTRRFEILVSHKMNYVLWFQSWGDGDRDFQSNRVKLAGSYGLTPIITWEPWKRDFTNPTAIQPEYSLASINSGSHDQYIRSWAKAAARTQVPLTLRFAHEQSTKPGDRSWYPWQGNPDAYRAAFRRIVMIFRDEGADNVKFLWSAMWMSDATTDLYYPGADVVDFIGTTVLNHGTVPSVDWAAWRSFPELFDGQYQAVANKWQKPFIITELATAEQGGNKADWLKDAFSNLKSRYPLVVGILLLEVQKDREWPTINWSVASSGAALQTFREVINNNYFK